MILKGFKEFINESESSVTYQNLKLLLELGISDDITDDVNRLIDQGRMTHEEILDWVAPICDKYEIQDWSISDPGLVDADCDVYLEDLELTRLPLRFGTVTGNFWCSDNQLTTLEGAPQWVGKSFLCSNNQLTTLEGAPKRVGGDFWCYNNQLTTLKGAPEKVGRDFFCRRNPLTSLDGIGKVKGKIDSDLNN